MFVRRGDIDFLQQFYDYNPNNSYKLRKIFDRFNLSYTSTTAMFNPSLNSESIRKNEGLITEQDSSKNEQANVINIEKIEKTFNPRADNFQKLVNNSSVFVDKTMFIKAFLDGGDHIIITRPRRWGKTLNMMMLEAFFQPEVDSISNLLEINTNRNLFTGGTNGKKPLKISSFQDLIDDHQGKTPVIFITFGNLSPGMTEVEIKENIRAWISDAYIKHDYIYRRALIEIIEIYNKQSNQSKRLVTENKKIDELEGLIECHSLPLDHESKKFQNYRSANSGVLLEESIKFLSMVLSNHFRKKCYAIIDEYDAPINNLIGQEEEDKIRQIQQTLNRIFSGGLKNNIYVDKAVLSGILNITKCNAFPGINNFGDRGVASPGRYEKFFGFTQEEVDGLLNNNISECKEDLKKQIKN